MNRRAVVGWCFYDFANSPFTTIVVTFIFSRYFTKVVAEDEIEGGVLWSYAIAASSAIVALGTPLLGAIADHSARKKQFLLWMTFQTIVFSALLFFVGPGDALIALIVFVLADVGFEAANVFYNALLPGVSTPSSIGRISGIGWGFGYVGGVIALAIALGMVKGWLPETEHLDVRSTCLLAAVWLALFAIPLFRWVPEGATSRGPARLMDGLRRLRETARTLGRYRQVVRFLIARLVYNDGLVTVFSFGAIYASSVFEMTVAETIVLGIALNVAAALGAFTFGFVNDRIGGKRTIVITLIALVAAALLGALATTRTGFWIGAIGIGLMAGANQSSSRTLLSQMTPADKQTELFGFFAFSGKLASVIGPIVYGTVLGATGSHRPAMLSIVAFFAVGLVLLLFVNERDGVQSATDP